MAQAYNPTEYKVGHGRPRKKKSRVAFECELNPQTDNWMQDFFWDSWADEVFMSQNISAAGGRETIKINRLGQEDASGVRPYISAMTLTEAGHGDVISIHRITNKLWIWVNWTHYDTNGTRHRDLVRFPWKSGTYTWNSKPPNIQIMPSFHSDSDVIQAKLDPLGKYIAYRISGNGQDEYELRSLTDVELNIDNVIHHLGPMPLTQAKATELGWTDRWVFQGYASTIDKLWRFTGTGNGNNTDPGAVTEYHWSTGAEVRHNVAGADSGEPEGLMLVRFGTDRIKVLMGFVRHPVRRFMVHSLTYHLNLSELP
jgi:hypothetical protein